MEFRSRKDGSHYPLSQKRLQGSKPIKRTQKSTKLRLFFIPSKIQEKDLKKNVKELLDLVQDKPTKLDVFFLSASQIPENDSSILGKNITKSGGTVTIWVNTRLKSLPQISNVVGHELMESSLMLKEFNENKKLKHTSNYYHNEAIKRYPEIFDITGKKATWSWWVRRG